MKVNSDSAAPTLNSSKALKDIDGNDITLDKTMGQLLNFIPDTEQKTFKITAVNEAGQSVTEEYTFSSSDTLENVIKNINENSMLLSSLMKKKKVSRLHLIIQAQW